MAVSGASALVLLMTLHRAATFGLNQLLLRYTNPAVFGAASVQLELLLGSALFIAREGMRLALLRVVAPPDASPQTVRVAAARHVNHAWLALPATLLTATFMAALYSRDGQVRVAWRCARASPVGPALSMGSSFRVRAPACSGALAHTLRQRTRCPATRLRLGCTPWRRCWKACSSRCTR